MDNCILKTNKKNALRSPVLFALTAVCLLTLLPEKSAFAWGAGMHATLNARAYERMTQRWKEAIDPDLIIYAAWTPDAWYILAEEMLSGSCGIACGAPDDSMSNECFNDYIPDRYFSYTRHMLANADGLKAISYALGYGGHAVGDYRGHLEYIIPDWRDPQGNGTIPISRHTFVDSVGDTLAFNVEGLYGYPTKYLTNKALYGYPSEILSEANYAATGSRNPYGGLVLIVETNYAGKRKAVFKGILDETAKGLSISSVVSMMDDSALSSVSEGLVAALYGLNDYDGGGRPFPVVIENGSAAINCATDLKQRMESEGGFGNSMPCQVTLANVSGLAQWTSFLKPADDAGQEVVVDKDKVAEWMRNIAVEFKSGDVYLDDPHVFRIDAQTGKSTADLKGIDGRGFTLGKTMPEILDEVLDKNIQDITDRLLENQHVLGTILQSKAGAFDKARFVSFGFHYRPRLTAWGATVKYKGADVKTLPETPGTFSSVEIPIDMRPKDKNFAPEMVYPFYVATIEAGSSAMKGKGTLEAEIIYKDAAGAELEKKSSFALNLQTGEMSGGEGFASLAKNAKGYAVKLLADNSNGGKYFYAKDLAQAALVIKIKLAAADPAEPPYDLQLDAVVQPYCAKPDLSKSETPSGDNSACPLAEPKEEEKKGNDGGCSADAAAFGALLFALLTALYARRAFI